MLHEAEALAPPQSSTPDLVWAPLSAGVLVLIPGLLGLWVNNPWLVPSLAPSVIMQTHHPQDAASRPGPMIMGHLIGIAAALISLGFLGANSDPTVYELHRLTISRVLASALAVGLTATFQTLTGFQHAPAAATVLLITFGAIQTGWLEIRSVIIGVLITALFGEIFRRLRPWAYRRAGRNGV